MICKFQFSYSQNGEMTEELWERVRKILPLVKPLIWKEKDGKQVLDNWDMHATSYVGDVRPLMALGLKLDLIGMGDDTDRNLFALRLFEKIESLESRLIAQALGNEGASHAFNQRCSVHVPSFGLLEINEVELRENHCTDALREDIEKGWRILAICPQPDQRRPDYVLGRVKR